MNISSTELVHSKSCNRLNLIVTYYATRNLLCSFKSLTYILFITTSITLTGCGGGSDGDSGQDNTVTPNPPKPNVDTNWQPSGGVATVPSNVSRPFLQLIPSLPASSLQGVSQGRELFITQWTPSGQGRPLFDGLGPIFNASTCTQCHSSEGRVTVFEDNGKLSNAILFRLGDQSGQEHPYYGGQIQHQSIDPSILGEGIVTYYPTPAQNGRPAGVKFNFVPSDNNQPLNGSNLSGRISPQLVGMGLLDLIPDESILAGADPDDSDNNGISGRVHWVFDNNVRRVGRFGWKAINSSLRTQNANAMSQDMGLTTTVFIDPNCTVNQPICWTSPSGGTPEVSDTSLDAVVDFMTALAVPERRIDNLDRFNQGANLFAQVGCSNCHTPKHTTGISSRFPLLSSQVIYPYTDLLLHDMGPALDDGVKEKDANSYEWRTPPLWGIGLVAKDPDARFLHDGRARSLKEAILWHGGEAQQVRDKFVTLKESEQSLLLDFLKSI